jgi:hypothetical protein
MARWMLFPEYRANLPSRNILINMDEARSAAEWIDHPRTKVTMDSGSSINIEVTLEELSLILGGERIGC